MGYFLLVIRESIIILFAFIIDTALSATGVFLDPVYPTGSLRTVNIIVADGGGRIYVIGKNIINIQCHTIKVTV